MSGPTPPRALALPPQAHGGRFSWAWLLPVAALVLVATFGWQAWSGRGPVLTVRAQEGHGIRVGDALRYRGIEVGEVRAVRLAPDAREVLLRVALEPGAEELARVGSRFWIVRPHVSLDEVTGLETLVGARYLTVLPGPLGAPLETEFRALAEPPPVAALEPGGLEVRLEAPRRHGLRRGAPLSYRGVEIGAVLSVELASDAGAVDVRAYVLPAYAALVREDSRFYEVSGLDVSWGLGGGLSIELESLRALLVGGIALATPTRAGDLARPGQVFRLATAPEKEWLEWRPTIPVGGAQGGNEAVRPQVVSARRTIRAGRFLARGRERAALVIAEGADWIGPAEVLAPEDGDDHRDAELWIDGARVLPPAEVRARAQGLARVARGEAAQGEPAPSAPRRPLGEPEACLLWGERGREALALDPARLEAQPEGWLVDPAVQPGPGWHGAAVVARSDGAWIGVLLVEGRRARIVAVP